MSRQGDIFGKYVGTGFMNGLSKGFDYADELQMLEDKQKQKDMYAGNQMADIYNAKKYKTLNPEFIKAAKNANNEYKGIVSGLGSRAENKANNTLNATPDFNMGVFDGNKEPAFNSILPSLKRTPSINFDDTSKTDYGIFSGLKTGEQLSPHIALNDYNDESKINLLGKSPVENNNLLVSPKLFSDEYSADIKNTLNEADKSFWNGNMELLKKLEAPFSEYVYNPASDYESFRDTPLTHDEKRISDLARSGNIYAVNDMYDEVYPQYNWNLRTRQTPSKDGKTMTVQEILSAYDKNGNYKENIINSYDTAIIDKDALAHKRAMELQRLKNAGNIAAKKAGKGKEEDDYAFRINDLEKQINERKITDANMKNILHTANKQGRGEAVSTYLAYNPNLKEVEYDDGIFGWRNNKKEYEAYTKALENNKKALAYAEQYDGGTDFLTNPINDTEIEYIMSKNYQLERHPDMLNYYRLSKSGKTTQYMPLSYIRDTFLNDIN